MRRKSNARWPNNRPDRLLLHAHQEEEAEQEEVEGELIQNQTRERLAAQARELMVPTAPGEAVGGSSTEPPALKGSPLLCAPGARRARVVMYSLSVRGMAHVCNWRGRRMKGWRRK